MVIEDKLKYLRSDTERNTISNQLDDVENLLGKLDSKNMDLAERILYQMDKIDRILSQTYADTEIPVAYQTQLQYIYNRIRSHAQTIISAIGGVEQLKVKRERAGKKEDAWWWYLDNYVNNNFKKSVQKTFSIIGIIVLIAVAVVIIYEQFFAPPPEVKARIRHEQAADRLVESGDFDGALQEIQAALKIVPGSYELWIWQGVIQQKRGDQDAAQQAFLKGHDLVDKLENYYLTKAYYEFISGLTDAGLADAQMLVAINPQSPEGFLYIGQAYENLGETTKALDAYEKASVLAEKSDNAELIATIKVRMGMLMQTSPLKSPLN
ncbi:MAG: tetratricopeptide repeat protein [Anaerolineaceae bacterium]|nr:MAG: hypothetical protein CVU46_17810 [Chloroflexi bacterium HGW-Chloroflexi-8]